LELKKRLPKNKKKYKKNNNNKEKERKNNLWFKEHVQEMNRYMEINSIESE